MRLIASCHSTFCYRWKVTETFHLSSKQGDAVYQLLAVIVFQGDEVKGGHYVAYRRGCNGTWYMCSDSLVRWR
jgi:ubiquitin C-terminal hydrolase